MPKDIEIPDYFKGPDRNPDLDKVINSLRKSWGILIIIFFTFMFLSGSVVRVGAGERAVVFNIFGGVEKRVLGEGINIIIPFIQSAYIYDVKQSTYNFATEDLGKKQYPVGGEIHVLTSDGQKLDIELTVRVSPLPSDLWKLHKYIGPDYAYKIIFPKARTILREILASYPVEDVYSSKRQEIQDKVMDRLKNDLLKKYYIDVEDVLIRNVKFSKEFQDAIDRKQQAYQEFLKMQYVLEGEKSKRDAKISKAEGEAKAINLRVNALKANPEFLKYRRAQVYGQKAKLIFSEALGD